MLICYSRKKSPAVTRWTRGVIVGARSTLILIKEVEADRSRYRSSYYHTAAVRLCREIKVHLAFSLFSLSYLLRRFAGSRKANEKSEPVLPNGFKGMWPRARRPLAHVLSQSCLPVQQAVSPRTSHTTPAHQPHTPSTSAHVDANTRKRTSS